MWGRGAQIVQNGLVLNLDGFNKKSYIGSGTLVKDLSIAKNNGTLVNGVGFDSRSFMFDGVNDYVSASQNSLLTGNPNISLSAWIYPLSVTGNKAVILLGDSDTALGGIGICIGINGSGSVSVEFWSGNGVRTLPSTIQINKWYNIVATKSSGTINTTTILYINGVSQSFGVTSTNTPNIVNNIISIGAIKGSVATQFYFQGNINQPMIYNRVLSQLEVLQNFNATKSKYGL